MKPEGKTVLVVDDDLEQALLYQELLQAHHYEAITAGDGNEALKLVLHTPVDAVVCDLSMPELAGDLFYREVGRARPELLRRFVFVTANADNPLYECFLRSTRAPVLAKPIVAEKLLAAVAGCLAAG
jgi:two-component system, cell cycle sensor histidine kinase and response regulator CckA